MSPFALVSQGRAISTAHEKKCQKDGKPLMFYVFVQQANDMPPSLKYGLRAGKGVDADNSQETRGSSCKVPEQRQRCTSGSLCSAESMMMRSLFCYRCDVG